MSFSLKHDLHMRISGKGRRDKLIKKESVTSEVGSLPQVKPHFPNRLLLLVFTLFKAIGIGIGNDSGDRGLLGIDGEGLSR